MATQLDIYEKERFTFYESYYGIDIDYDQEKKMYVSFIWSEHQNKGIDLEFKSAELLKNELRFILVDNFYKSLTEIKEHFNHTSDFNNPQQNLENLRVAANKKVVELLEDIL
jgi:predicted nuclease with TOPRIM domain